MDIKQIEIVIAVADRLSFSEAAFDLSFSASVISKNVLSIEKELGLKIFDRKARAKVSLTKEGLDILPYFRRIITENDQLQARTRELVKQERKIISFACPTPLGTLKEELLLSKFFFRHPEITVIHQSLSDKEILRQLENGKIDVGMGVLMDDNDLNDIFINSNAYKELEFMPIESHSMNIAMSAAHPLAAVENLKLIDFKDETFAFKSEGGEIFQGKRITAFINICKSNGFEPKILFLNGMRNKTICEVIISSNLVFPALTNIDHFFQRSGIISQKLNANYLPAKTMLYYNKSNKAPELKAFLKCAEAVSKNSAFDAV